MSDYVATGPRPPELELCEDCEAGCLRKYELPLFGLTAVATIVEEPDCDCPCHYPLSLGDA